MQADLFQGQLIRLCAPRPEDPEVLSHWSEDGVYRRHADTDPPRPVTAEHFRERDEMVDSDHDNFEFRIRTIDEDRLVGFVAASSGPTATPGWRPALGTPRTVVAATAERRSRWRCGTPSTSSRCTV